MSTKNRFCFVSIKKFLSEVKENEIEEYMKDIKKLTCKKFGRDIGLKITDLVLQLFISDYYLAVFKQRILYYSIRLEIIFKKRIKCDICGYKYKKNYFFEANDYYQFRTPMETFILYPICKICYAYDIDAIFNCNRNEPVLFMLGSDDRYIRDDESSDTN